MPLVSPTVLPSNPDPLGKAGVGRFHLRVGQACIAALIAGASVATPFAANGLIEVPGYLPMFSAGMIVINLILAGLLFIKGTIEQRSGTTQLGAAYLYVSLIFIPQTMNSPGAIMPDPIIGSGASALWLWVLWHIGFSAAIIHYAWFGARPMTGHRHPLLCFLAAVVAATAAALLSTAWVDKLPPLMTGGQYLFGGPILVVPYTVAACALAALASVARLRARTAEQLWLTVGMVAACIDVWLTLRGGTRFSLGWYLSKAGSL